MADHVEPETADDTEPLDFHFQFRLLANLAVPSELHIEVAVESVVADWVELAERSAASWA